MDSIQANAHKGESYILKSNLWKFFKTLRVQANSFYALLAASPIDIVYIEIIGRADGVCLQRLSVAQFVDQLSKLPGKQVSYRLNIKIWGDDGEVIWSASKRESLSEEVAPALLPAMIMYLCRVAAQQGDVFILTPQVIAHYHFRRRYLEELELLVFNCNARIARETNTANQ